jgi:hypothetical protein
MRVDPFFMEEAVRVMGIDPGIDGALAILDYQDKTVEVIDIPTLGEAKQREVDAGWLLGWVLRGCVDHIYCEAVHSMPEQGVASSFKFGLAVGQLRAVMQCSRVPFSLITPQTWKKHFGLKGSDKEKSRQLALRLFPHAASDLQRKMDHQRAEAILIAAFGYERMIIK